MNGGTGKACPRARNSRIRLSRLLFISRCVARTCLKPGCARFPSTVSFKRGYAPEDQLRQNEKVAPGYIVEVYAASMPSPTLYNASLFIGSVKCCEIARANVLDEGFDNSLRREIEREPACARPRARPGNKTYSKREDAMRPRNEMKF